MRYEFKYLFSLMTALVGCGAHAHGILMIENPVDQHEPNESMRFMVGGFAGNDVLPVRRLSELPWPTDYDSRPGVNEGLGNLRLAIDYRRDDWTLGYFYRQDWKLRTVQDSVDVYAATTHGRLPDTLGTFQLNYRVRGFSADGLKVGYTWRRDTSAGGRFSMGMAASLLRGRSLRDDHVDGQLINSAQSAEMSGYRDWFASDLAATTPSEADGMSDFTPAIPMSHVNGWGFGLDFGVNYMAANGVSINLVANDIASRIDWSRIPYLHTDISAAKVICEEDKCVPSRVGANWNSTYRRYDLKLDPKFQVEVLLPFGQNQATLRAEALDGDWYPQIEFDFPVSSRWRLGFGYEPRFRTVSASLHDDHFLFSLSSERFDFAEGNSLGLMFGWHRRLE